MTARDGKRLEIQFGALCPSLKVQLRRQGWRFDTDALHHAQLDANAVTRLKIRGFINDTVARRVRQRIVANIQQAVQP